MKIETRFDEIFYELCKLNQFIQRNEERATNILNGSEITYRGSDEMYIRWELVDVKADKIDIKTKAKLQRLELHEAEKFLRTMTAQSLLLDSTGATQENHSDYTVKNV